MPTQTRRTLASLLVLTSLGWALSGVAAEPLPSLEALLKDYKALGLPLLKQDLDSEDLKFYELLDEDKLVLAIQCHERRLDKMARQLLEESQKEDKGPPRTRLIRYAWDYWASHLIQPEIDRTPAAKRLHELIGQDKELDNERNRALLHSLDLALVPSKAKPGSVEVLIDDLVDYHCGSVGPFLSYHSDNEKVWRIADLGFDAIPALLEHVDDVRLTRGMTPIFNNFLPRHIYVGDLVGDLLEGLAGQDLGRGWLRGMQGYRVNKAEAQKWWDQARKVGEETYLLDHLFSPERTDGWRGKVHATQLNLIRIKYPKHIPALYRRVLEKRPDVDSGSLAAAVLDHCKVPYQEKLDLFVYAAKHKDYYHRLYALRAIKELDKRLFDALLLGTIESLPEDVPGPYANCAENYVAKLAVDCEDSRVWQMLEKVARRSALGLRMELLSGFGDPFETRHQRERLRLLASFLDDASLRDENSSTKFDGVGAGFPYPKIEVRDFVALEIAELLKIEIKSDLKRSPEEWAKIRTRVREAVKRELDKMK
jgi:hypothetical protein